MLLITFIVFTAIAALAQGDTLSVSVYYESLCPDSKQFITTQLYPAYEQISNYLNVQFFPYGNADITTSEDGTLNFTCQHGPNECYGNEIQACAISIDPQNSIQFVDCAMASDDASNDENLQQCAESSAISWDSIKECISSGLGDQLFVHYGELTDSAHINFVPTIFFNGVFNETLQNLGQFDFLPTACLLLNEEPSACSSTE
ncbi:GILT-like protein 1 [Zophobas morio]|uniref:GILT-like protein 1 n=1 Tax=Zophobas morio TaxID=2755281 RepID=UPI0030829B5E